MIVYTLSVLVMVLAIYFYVTTDEDAIIEREVSNKEYEGRFIQAVAKLDRGNINWTLKALVVIKDEYKYYEDSDKAMSLLRVLEKGANAKDVSVIRYIKLQSLK